MIINLERTIIRIVLIIIIIFVLCQLGIHIRKNYKVLKFYDYRTKKLKIDKLNELNNINNLKKQLIQNESKYDISKNNLKYTMNNYAKIRKNCKTEKAQFILKVNTLAVAKRWQKQLINLIYGMKMKNLEEVKMIINVFFHNFKMQKMKIIVVQNLLVIQCLFLMIQDVKLI